MSAQLAKNTLWSLLDIILYPLLMIIATPVFIRYLGAEQYGIWMMAGTVNQFMNVLNFGLADSTVKAISSNRAGGSTGVIIDKIRANFSRALWIAAFVCVFGLVLAFSGLIHRWFHVPTAMQQTASSVLVLAFASTGIKFTELVLLSVFKGYERFDISARLSILSRNSVVLSGIVMVVISKSLFAVFLTTVLLNLINSVVQVMIVLKKYPFLQLNPGFSGLRLFDDKQQFWYWLQSVLGLIGFLSDKMIVGYFGGLTVLGYYATASLIGSQIYNALTALGNFMFPKVALRFRQKQTITPLYYRSRFIIVTLGWGGISFLILFGGSLFEWWLGKSFYSGVSVFIQLYLIYIAVLMLNIIPSQFINGSDRVQYNSWIELLLRASHLIVMPFGYMLYGAEGLLWSLIIVTFFILPVQYFLFHKHILLFPSVRRSVALTFLPVIGIIGLAFNAYSLVSMLFVLFSVYFTYYQPAGFNFWKK